MLVQDNKEYVYILRETPEDEETLDDGSVVRIDTGRVLLGTYYDRSLDAINFTIEVASGAISGLFTAAGLALASFTTLMAF